MFDYVYEPGPMTREEIEQEVEYLKKNDTEISSLLRKTKVPVKVCDCGQNIRALYNIKKKEIWISDRSVLPGTLKEALMHECIHSYDHIVRKIDIGTIEGLARTEVHAMKMCECKSSWFKKSCTRRKSIQAVTLSVGDQQKAENAVSSVFDDAYFEMISFCPYD